MSENTDRWDAQLNAAVSHMMTLEAQDERDAYAKAFRQSMGFESRFTSDHRTTRGRFWNWLIDAERTRVSGIAPIVPAVLILSALALTGLFAWLYTST